MSKQNLSLEDTQTTLSKAIKRIEEVLEKENDAKATNAANCLSGLVKSYSKIVQTVELEKRIEKLEQKQKMRAVK
jgi:hypothetical protein